MGRSLRVGASRGIQRGEGRRPELESLNARLAPSLGFYSVILLLAVVAPSAAAFGFLAVALVAVIRA